MTISEEIRHQLIVLAQTSKTRTSEPSRTQPTKWYPERVRNPNGELDNHFTDSSAWELVTNLLKSGHPVETIELKKPRGATGYVMLIDIEDNQPQLYVKLQLGSGQIFGRSFHYSDT